MSTAETPQSIVGTQMGDTARQTAGGKVLRHFTMSLDGFVAGPNHAVDWMSATSHHPEDAQPAKGVTFLSCDVAKARPDRARGRRRQEPRGLLAHDRPTAPRTRTDRRDRSAHRAGAARRRVRLFDNPGARLSDSSY